MTRNERPTGQPKQLFDHDTEAAVVGACLRDATLFWDLHGRIDAGHFTLPRLARVWDAMVRLANEGQTVAREQIPKAIKNDDKAESPLSIYLAMLIKAAPEGGTAKDLAETLVMYAEQRALIAALDAARAEIMAADFSVSPEALKETVIGKVTAAGTGGFDRYMKTYGEWADDVHKQACAAHDASQSGEATLVGLEPGLRAVQEVMGRLMPGRLYVLAGMSSSGKSALARQIAEHAAMQLARHSLGCGYIASLEMSGDEHLVRALAERIGVPASSIEEGSLQYGDLYRMQEQVSQLRHLPIVIDSRPRMRMEDMRNRMLRLKHQKGLGFAVIDHLLLIKPEGSRDSMLDRVANATIDAKFLARELHIPVIMLAQLNEKAILERPSGMPNGSDLFGGQPINQNADVVAFVHRQEIVEMRREPPQGDQEKHAKWSSRLANLRGKAVIFNDKRRGGARHAKGELLFDAPLMTFRDAS
jgi:replicative DNA helicase